MSRYSTPFCSDEELLKELNKLGYNEVPPEIFERMKDDLSELVAKEQNECLNTRKKEQQSCFQECDYKDESPLSSKYLSATSDCLSEWRTLEQNYMKPDSYVSRKTKKKSQKTSSRHLSNPDDEILTLESSRFMQRNNTLDGKSSHASLEYSIVNDEDGLSDLRNSPDKCAKANKLKSNNIYSSRISNVDCNKNGNRYSSIPKNLSPKENDSELSYTLKNEAFRSDISPALIKNKATKESKTTKSWEKIQEISDPQNMLNDNTLKCLNDGFRAFNLDEDIPESNAATLNYYKSSDINLNSSSTTNKEKKTIKRKVLRRRNGRSVITEELVEIPSIFDTSYPETENLNSSKSFSSDDLSYKSNSSSGSITILSPESSIKSSPSTFSLSSRSTSLRISNTRKKKSDPVAMYNYYKKFWDNFKPPGENTRDRLRWAVRDKMLEYHI